MKRGMELDVLACPCGARREPIAVIEDLAAIVAILAAMGLPATAPPVAPARPPPGARCRGRLPFEYDDASNDDEQPFSDVD